MTAAFRRVSDREILGMSSGLSDRAVAAHLGIKFERVALVRDTAAKNLIDGRRKLRPEDEAPNDGALILARRCATQGSDALLNALILFHRKHFPKTAVAKLKLREVGKL